MIMEPKEIKPNLQNFLQILCSTHDINCANICLFPNCTDSFLCSKCISKHNPQHLNKILSLQEFLYDQKNGVIQNSENIISELSYTLNYFENQFKEKHKNVQTEIKNIFLQIKDSFLKQLDFYQQKCLNYTNQNFEKIVNSISKLQDQIEQNQSIISQFNSQNSQNNQSNLHQKLKNMINLNTKILPNLKDIIQKSKNEFYTLNIKIHAKEYLENFDLHLKQIFLDHENMITFLQSHNTRFSKLESNTSSERKSYKKLASSSINPEKQLLSIDDFFSNKNDDLNNSNDLSIEYEIYKKIDVLTPVNTLYLHNDSNSQKLLFVGCNNCLIKIYDLISGKHLNDLKGHEGAVKSFVYINDTKTLMSGSLDNTIKLWDLSNCTNPSNVVCLKTLLGHNDYIRVLLYVEEMRIIASAGEDKIIKLWDVMNMQCIGNLLGHKKGVYCLVNFNKFLISGSSDFFIKIWKIPSKECYKTIAANQGSINSFCLLYKNELLAVGACDKSIKIWDTKTWIVKNILIGHSNYICSIISINDEKNIISASADNKIKVWSVEKEICLKTFDQHENWVLTLLSASNLRCFISGSSDSKIIIWKKYDEKKLLDSNFI